MKAAIVSTPSVVTISDLPMPQVGPWDALVRIEACALCGTTDLDLIDRRHLSDKPLPMLLGHESVGTVLQVGNRVRNIAPGQRVLRPGLIKPPEGYSTAWGGLAEYGLVTDADAWAADNADYGMSHRLWPKQQVIPSDIPAAEATALVGLKEALSACELAGVDNTTWTAVVGSGWAARALAYWASQLRAPFVVAFGQKEGLCHDFIELGANNYIAGDQPCSEDDAKVAGVGAFDRVLVAESGVQAQLDGLALARPEGEVGCWSPLVDAVEPPVQLLKARKAGRLRNLRIKEEEVHDKVLAAVSNGALQLDRWISHRLPLSEINQAVELMRSGQALKVVVEL